MIKYIGKILLIEEKDEKIIVIGDIHLAQSSNESAGEAFVNKVLFEKTIKDLDEIFDKVDRVGKIVLLGDLKHLFQKLEKSERYDLINLFDYLEKKTDDIVIIK